MAVGRSRNVAKVVSVNRGTRRESRSENAKARLKLVEPTTTNLLRVGIGSVNACAHERDQFADSLVEHT